MNTFKVGDRVKFRDAGGGMVVVSVSGINGRELVVQSQLQGNYGQTTSRCLNGRMNDWQDGPEDIVPIPPEPLKWNEKWGDLFEAAAMDANGAWFVYTGTPRAGLVGWVAAGHNCVSMPPHLAPAFTGDWRQSIIERPHL